MVTGAAAQERCCGWPTTEATGPALGRRDDPDSAHRRAQAAAGAAAQRQRGEPVHRHRRLVVFTMVGQEPLRCPGPAWAAAAARC